MFKLQLHLTTMKKILAVLALLCFTLTDLQANPGDTTWVTVWNKRWLDHYGAYDTTATFPTGKQFRKIRLHYILGRYACPGSPQYCGSWDYTTQIFARHAGMDSVEVARVITPYATDWLTKGITHDYIVEVTDYAKALDGQTGLRFHYSGYSWGFTITLKIEFIEGVPPMDVQNVRNIYKGYFPYGNGNNPIENYLTAKTFSYNMFTGYALVKNFVSGHGADGGNCAEFCSKYYQLKLNGTMLSQKQLWRTDCGLNQVYPQTGTWIYDRANWCPGAVVWPIYHDITANTTANQNFTVDVDMQPYSMQNPSAGYEWSSQLVEYAKPNHTLDVSLEDVITPNTDLNYVRNNPACNNPKVLIKNTGTSTVTSVEMQYGYPGGTMMTFTWTGSLNFLDTTTVLMPPSNQVMNNTVTAAWQVSITAVNGVADQNKFNDVYNVSVAPVVAYPDTMVVKFYTNKSQIAGGYNESNWQIVDDFNSVVYSRTQNSITTLYIDTIVLYPGCYRFQISDDGCDGLSWWANSAGGSGSCKFEKRTGGNIYSFPVDIGCGFEKSFIVKARVKDPDTTAVAGRALLNSVEVFPNPAAAEAWLKIDLELPQSLKFTISDVTGKTVQSQQYDKIQNLYQRIDLSSLPGGVYIVSARLGDGSLFTQKLIVE